LGLEGVSELPAVSAGSTCRAQQSEQAQHPACSCC
jgi:hypothetical protein